MYRHVFIAICFLTLLMVLRALMGARFFPVESFNSQPMFRIGFICTYPADEIAKAELADVNTRKRPWLQHSEGKHRIKIQQQEYVPLDVSVAYYLRWKLRNDKTVHVDIFYPNEVDALQRAQRNEINFILIYDLLEAFHTEPDSEFPGRVALLTHDSVFPPSNYQALINHKHQYYTFLQETQHPCFTIRSHF
jgi:hypothetical protein